MSRKHLLLLAATFATAASAARADPITTDHIVFTYNTAATSFAPAATYQYNVSFTDGVVAQNTAGDYNFKVMVYSGADTAGTPYSGNYDLFPAGRTTQLNFSDGYLYGNTDSPLQGTTQTGFLSTALLFKPGTYTVTNPLVYSSSHGTLASAVSASYTITQTVSGPVGPVSVTPEPSSLALLGTGFLALTGTLRRRISARA